MRTVWPKRAERLLLLVIVLVVAGCANTIRVTQRDIQQQIDSRLPLGTGAGAPVSLSLQELRCELLAAPVAGSDNVELDARVQFAVLGLLQIESRAAMRGRLVYDAGRGAFFIEQPQLLAVDIDRVPAQQRQLLMANLQPLVSAVLARTPVYTLQDERVRTHIDHVEVRGGVMVIHLRP
jgi:predicted small secreted protein